MSTRTFKTNIHCTGCLSKVAPFLNQAAGEDNWEVDIQNPDKILTVTSENADSDSIQSALEQAGYKAEAVS
jgi:copper chaperone